MSILLLLEDAEKYWRPIVTFYALFHCSECYLGLPKKYKFLFDVYEQCFNACIIKSYTK